MMVDNTWSEQPVERLRAFEDYKAAKIFVCTVKTINDMTERAVKMAADLSQILTKDEDTRRRIIQGVEDHRRAYLDFKKSTFSH